MRTFILLVKFLIVPLGIGFVLALLASAFTQTYIQRSDHAARVRTAVDLITGLRAGSSYATYLTVLSFNPESRELIASVHSAAANQSIPQLLKLSDNFKVERRDAIIRDGVIVGTKLLQPAVFSELQPNTRGLGVFSITENGTTNIEYLLIGDPFPRP